MPYRYQRIGLHHLRYFAAVAEERSFRRAAEALHVAQPAISRAVRQLETDLDRPLLRRSPHGTDPTADGEIVLTRTLHILEAIDRLGDGLPERAQPTVRVGHVLPEYNTHGPLADLLRAFFSTNSTTAMEVVPMLPKRMLAALAADDLDLGFAWLPMDDVPAGLQIDIVLVDEPVVAIPPTHALSAKRGPVRLIELRSHPVLIFPRHALPERYDEIAALLHRAGAADGIRMVTSNLHTVLMAVSRGEGLSIVPRIAAESHSDLQVTLRPIAGVSAPWRLAMVAPPHVHQRAASRLVAALRERQTLSN